MKQLGLLNVNNEVKVLLFEALNCDVPPYYLGGKIVLPVKVIVMRRVHLSKIKKKIQYISSLCVIERKK